MKKFSERLKELRKTKNVTQKEAAIALDITERNYQSWEGGKSKPGYDAILTLCDYFNVSADYLLGRTEEP